MNVTTLSNESWDNTTESGMCISSCAKGNYVDFNCDEGTITVDSSPRCNHEAIGAKICSSSSCSWPLTGTMDSGDSFGHWQADADGGTLSVSNPNEISTTLHTSDEWRGSAPSLIECSIAPTVSGVHVQVQSKYEQAWVNWSESNSVVGETLFEWGTVPVTVSQPQSTVD